MTDNFHTKSRYLPLKSHIAQCSCKQLWQLPPTIHDMHLQDHAVLICSTAECTPRECPFCKNKNIRSIAMWLSVGNRLGISLSRCLEGFNAWFRVAVQYTDNIIHVSLAKVAIEDGPVCVPYMLTDACCAYIPCDWIWLNFQDDLPGLLVWNLEGEWGTKFRSQDVI